MAEFEGDSRGEEPIIIYELRRRLLRPAPFPYDQGVDAMGENFFGSVEQEGVENPEDPASSIVITHIGGTMPIEVEQFAVDALVDAMGDQGGMVYPRKEGDGKVIPLRIFDGGVDTEAKGE